MATNAERYALVMGNSFPEFRFKPKVLDTANWTPSRSVASADVDDERSEDSKGPSHLVNKPIVMHRSKSPNHPSRHVKPVALYNKEYNPSPLSLSRNATSSAHAATASKKPSRRMSETPTQPCPHIVEAKPAASTADASPRIHAVFNNQLTTDDLHVFYTKLGGRKIVDFLVHPGRELSKFVSGAVKGATDPLAAGVTIVCFPFHAASMLGAEFTFPVKAAPHETTPVTMTFSVNHARDAYDLFAINGLGQLESLGVLGNQAATHDTFADHPFVVWCRGSGRAFCIHADDAAAVAKVKYSIVVDDNIPSVSFMATAKPASVASATPQPHATVCMSFFPR